jgi:outer membrane lipoprotein-sorting protein
MKFVVILFLFPLLSFAKAFVPNSFTANFEETIKSVTGKEKKTYGKVDYKFPGNLRFEVTRPEKSLFIINPKKTWFYQPAFIKGEKDQVTIQKSADLPLIKFLDSVKNGVENSKLFTIKYEKNAVVLTFVKTIQKEMGVEAVTLNATGDAKAVKELKDFASITLIRGKNSKSTIKLLDLKEDASFSPGNFEFTPSPNTKVIQN